MNNTPNNRPSDGIEAARRIPFQSMTFQVPTWPSLDLDSGNRKIANRKATAEMIAAT